MGKHYRKPYDGEIISTLKGMLMPYLNLLPTLSSLILYISFTLLFLQETVSLRYT